MPFTRINLPTFLLSATLALAPVTAAAQSKVCSQIEAEKKKVYGFHPEEVSSEVREQKSSQMEEFWELVRSKGKDGKQCLTEIVRSEKKDGYFLFDGAVLLESLDPSGLAMPVIVDSVARASLHDVDAASYIDFAMKLNSRGADITTIARNYLHSPTVEVYVPAYSLRLDRDLGALLLYGSMPASQRDQALVAMLSARDSAARFAAIRMLSTCLTEDAFRALANTEITPDFPDSVRRDLEGHKTWVPTESSSAAKYSREEVLTRLRQLPGTKDAPISVAGDETFLRSAINTLTEADLPLAQEARRKSIQDVSDRSIYEYLAHTRILLGVINRLDLFKEYRNH